MELEVRVVADVGVGEDLNVIKSVPLQKMF